MPNNSQTISNNKIVFFVVFICAAIITSVFVFHMRQQPVQPALAPELGLVFPVPRDIKSFELDATTSQKFSEKNFYQHWTLLFFGFTHCASVCPTTMAMIGRTYDRLHEKYPNLQVALVSLDPERDTLASLTTYTHSYHPDFIGLTGKLQELRKLQSQLGVYSARDSQNAAAGSNYQIQHTSSIMLINPQGKWAGLFKFGLRPEQFAQAFEQAVKQLTKLSS